MRGNPLTGKGAAGEPKTAHIIAKSKGVPIPRPNFIKIPWLL
jgi:hypothetical protein